MLAQVPDVSLILGQALEPGLVLLLVSMWVWEPGFVLVPVVKQVFVPVVMFTVKLVLWKSS